MMRYLIICTITVASLAPSGLAAEPTAADLQFFEKKIRPLFAEHCYKCHGPKKQKSELRLDTAEGLKKGGYSGSPVVPGKPEASLLIKSVQHAEGVEAMPPKKKLKASEIADLAAWVKRGAPYPATVKTAENDPARHWAYQPLIQPPLPEVKDRSGVRNDLDLFIQAKRETVGLGRVKPATKESLIRRATFDLTGLPPTPQEIEAFLADGSAQAFSKVLDRLLASPAYGQRWGRHWLDVARYADSNGLDENVAHGNAWRYRDYVIDAFNSDKPYDRFLLEQIAGDLLPGNSPDSRSERLIATGFLALGPKVLAEPDEKKMEMDIIDEELDTLCRAVMGMTMGCARCHDHKFDPITAADYYGLAGILASTRTMESFKKVARWYENSLASPSETKEKARQDAEMARVKGRIKALKGKKDAGSKDELKKLQARLASLEKSSPDLPSAMGAHDGAIVNLPILKRGNHLTPGVVIPRRFPVILAGQKQTALPTGHSGRLQLARWLTDPKHPLTARVMVNRIWRWHFGKGLVATVDNFGLLGDKPSHPKLLDWLATRFIHEGWSLKKLHRIIMLSATYQMSSEYDAKAAAADPENRLLWRVNRRRLEAEAIRDSLLAVGGLLSREAGGPAFTNIKNRQYFFDHTSKDKTSYDTNRRSVYLPIIRNNLYDVFQLFDSPDPAVSSGDRATTTVPTQALFFLNSKLAERSADALAGRLLSRPNLDDAGRIRLLYRLAYGRLPGSREIKRFQANLEELSSSLPPEKDPAKHRLQAWSAACQMVFASNEFIHVQ